jgi:hypothetical protein
MDLLRGRGVAAQPPGGLGVICPAIGCSCFPPDHADDGSWSEGASSPDDDGGPGRSGGSIRGEILLYSGPEEVKDKGRSGGDPRLVGNSARSGEGGERSGRMASEARVFWRRA